MDPGFRRFGRYTALAGALFLCAGAASAQTGSTAAACSQIPAGLSISGKATGSCASASAIEVGDALGKAGRRGEAFAWYLVAAHGGDVRAQAWVGSAFRGGGLTSDGIPASRPHAAYWLNRAASAGSEDARRAFNEMYRETAAAAN